MIRSVAQAPDDTSCAGRSTSVRVALLLIALAIVAAGVFLVWRYHPDLTLLRDMLAPLRNWERDAPVRFALLFFAATVAITGFCIPIEILIGLIAGAVFGLVEGTLLVSFASSIGATITFLGARFLLSGVVERRFPKGIARLDQGLERDGAIYLFTLRLLPVVPFTLVNILMGLTNIKLSRFYLVSQIGMLPATLIYVNAGTQLAHLTRIYDIVSPPMILALVLIGLLPWFGKGVVAILRERRRRSEV